MLQNTKRRLSTLSVIAISLALICGAILVEKRQEKLKEKPNMNLSINQILSEYDYFDLWFPMDENKSLSFDASPIYYGDGQFNLFLPGGTDVSNLAFYIRDSEGNLLARRAADFRGGCQIGDYLILVKFSTIPTMCIELRDHDSYEYILESNDKKTDIFGDMKITVPPELAKEKGWPEEYVSREGDEGLEGTMSIHGRGNVTWYDTSKRSFSLSLEKGQNLLGMGYRKDWNLISQIYDRTLVRNMVFNNIAKAIGIDNQPEMQYVALYIDGEYKGVYLLTSKVRAGKNDISLKNEDYLFNIDAPFPEQYVTYKTKNWLPVENEGPVVEIVYPKLLSEKRRDKAQEIIQNLYDSIENDESDIYLNYIDVESMAKYYLIQEASMNLDAWGRSLYCRYDSGDGKIYMGPVWDMDLTLGHPYERAGMSFDTPEGWRIRNEGIYKGLFEHESFKKAVWDAYYHGGVREALYDAVDEFSSYAQYVGIDGERNYSMYGWDALKMTLGFGGDGYLEECHKLMEFYQKRIDWIDAQMEINSGL